MDKIPSVPATIASMSRTVRAASVNKRHSGIVSFEFIPKVCFFLTAFDKMEQAADKVQR